MTKVVEAIGRPPAQVALNWARQQDRRIIPQLGARTGAQLRDNLACLDWALTPEHLRQLDEASTIPLGFPNSFLADDEVTELILGAMRSLIDAPLS